MEANRVALRPTAADRARIAVALRASVGMPSTGESGFVARKTPRLGARRVLVAVVVGSALGTGAIFAVSRALAPTSRGRGPDAAASGSPAACAVRGLRVP